jgi:hypothetical protein
MGETITIRTGAATEVIKVIEQGPQGPQGPKGDPGDVAGLPLTTAGDTLYRASSGQNARLPIGSAGQILKVAASGIPEWGAAPASGVSSVNGETGTVILDGSDIDTSGNDDLAAFVTYEFADGNGTYYPLPDSTLNSKRVYRNTTGHHVFFQSLRWHITDGSPITANIIESSDDDNAAWPWLSAWSGDVDKAKIADVIGRARDTFLFIGDSVPSTSVSGLGTAATADSTAFASASHTHGNLTNDGKVGTTANLPLKTGTNGVVEAGSFGTAAGSFCEGNDARLSDARTPTAHAASHAAAGSDPVFISSLGQIVDALSDDPPTARINLGAAASGSITTSGLTQATARILGRTTASTGAVEEITVGSGLSLSAGELSATGSGVTAVGASTADVLSVSGSDLVADDAGADRIIFWDDSESKLRYLEAGTGLSISGTTLTATATGTIGGSTSTDNAIVRADSTSNTVQESALLLDDATTTTQNNVTIRNNHSETNSALVLTPKGTGAFIVGPKPDGTSTGGNARGTNSICLNAGGRSNANQVASGNSAIAVGATSRAAGNQSTALAGGQATLSEAVAVGPNSSASGNYSVAIGRATASAQGSIAIGENTTASGTSALAIGGFDANASGVSSVAFGERTASNRLGMMAMAAGRFSANGDAQWAKFILRCKTTTDAAVEMALNGSTTYLTIPSGKVIFCNIKVVGVKSDGAVVATYERQYAAKNVAGTSSEVFAPVTIGTDNASSTSLEVATVDAGDYIRIRPTGITSETWRWVASVDAVEVAYGT